MTRTLKACPPRTPDVAAGQMVHGRSEHAYLFHVGGLLLARQLRFHLFLEFLPLTDWLDFMSFLSLSLSLFSLSLSLSPSCNFPSHLCLHWFLFPVQLFVAGHEDEAQDRSPQ